jgi:hypothetical protein
MEISPGDIVTSRLSEEHWIWNSLGNSLIFIPPKDMKFEVLRCERYHLVYISWYFGIYDNQEYIANSILFNKCNETNSNI